MNVTAAAIRTTSIRVRLFLIALAASLPVVVFSAFIVVQMAADRRARETQDLVQRASAVAAAVEQALFGVSRELTTLAVARNLLQGDLAGAYEEASRFAAQSSIGESISLLTPDGRILFNTRRKLGEALPPSGDPSGVVEAAQSRHLRFSNLFVGAIDGRPIITVDVPVLRDAQVIYVIHMVVSPNKILRILRSQDLSDGWVASVLDRDGITIARTQDPEGSLGYKAGAGVLRAVAEKRTGTYETVNRAGVPVVGSLRRIEPSGWVVAVAVPRDLLDAQRSRFLALLGGGALLILAAAAWLTVGMARQLEQRLVDVGGLAGRLGAGLPVAPRATGIRELDAAANSLSRAGVLIASREAELKHAGKVAHDALASKAKFFAAANHDLRQPMQSLFLFHATMANMLAADHPARKPLAYADRSLQALERLLNGLRDVSRLDAGAVVPIVSVLSLDDVLTPLAEEYRLRAAEQGIALRYVGCALWVKSDPALLDRIIRNLLENAIRYTSRGGRILLGCRRRAGHVRIHVVDTGMGIPADQLGVIFEEFHQLGNPARDSALGLGLGLAIVRRACDLVGHGISVASALGKGSTFTLHLPKAQPQ